MLLTTPQLAIEDKDIEPITNVLLHALRTSPTDLEEEDYVDRASSIKRSVQSIAQQAFELGIAYGKSPKAP